MAGHVAAGLLFLSPGYIRPDSVAIFSYVRSAVCDGDFSFFNEWAMAGLVRGGVTLFSEITPVGALANHWWIGTSMLSAIPYAIARLFSSGDGFTGLIAVVLAWTNVAFAIGCALVAYLLNHTDAERRGLAIGMTMIGTPLFWYTYRFPLGTHVAGAFCVALLLVALFGLREQHDAIAGLAAGLALGLAVATRLQHFVLAPAVAYAAIRQKRSAAWWGAAVAGGLLSMAPQLIAWSAIYGSPFGPLASGGNLTGTTWMPFQNIALVTVLFSSYHGLFAWSPVVILAILGWLRGARSEDPVRRTVAITLILMFAGEWIANGTLDRYFWGGMSFGGRRFVDLAVPIAVGLAWFATTTAAVVLEIVLALWCVALMAAANSQTLSLSRYVSGADLMQSVLVMRGFGPLRSAVTNGALATQTLVAVLIVGGVACLMFVLARDGRRAVITSAALIIAFIGVAIVAGLRTRPHAADSIAGLRINAAASRRAGPLLDQRGLLTDEIAWAEATGREERAARTRAEVDEINRVLRSLPR